MYNDVIRFKKRHTQECEVVVKMSKRYNYEKYDTIELLEIWCFNSNIEITDKVERILESRGIDLSAENVQKIL